jgi:hypothetical protein
MRPTILQPASMTISKSTTPITPIRLVGRIRVNPSCEPRRSVKRVVNNVMVEHGFALGPSDLNGPCIRPGLTNGPLHDWQRTYEMDI